MVNVDDDKQVSVERPVDNLIHAGEKSRVNDNGGTRRKQKHAHKDVFFSGEGGIRTRGGGLSPRTHLAGEPNRPLWHLPIFDFQDDLGGGSGIRTHVGVTLTCFQDMRLKPLGHPSLCLNASASDFTISYGSVYIKIQIPTPG